MALGTYQGTGEVAFDSNTLAEASSVRARVRGNANPQLTMKKGFAGRSKGAPQSEITVENAAPLAGFEDEFVEKCVANADVQITIFMAGKSYIFDGYIDDVDFGAGVQSNANLSFTVIAGPPTIVSR